MGKMFEVSNGLSEFSDEFFIIQLSFFKKYFKLLSFYNNFINHFAPH